MRVRCRAVRWVPHIVPGAVEAYIADCAGFEWQVVAKYVDFNEDLGPDTGYPCPATMTCDVDLDDDDCLWISLRTPKSIVYEVPRSALIDDPS